MFIALINGVVLGFVVVIIVFMIVEIILGKK